MGAKIEVDRNRKGEYSFRLKAANGEIIVWSEGYKNYADAMNGIRIMKGEAPVAPIKFSKELQAARDKEQADARKKKADALAKEEAKRIADSKKRKEAAKKAAAEKEKAKAKKKK